MVRSAWLGILLLTLCSAAAPQTEVYRCPGPPVLYTDAMTPAEARERGCKAIEGTPITVLQTPRPRVASAAALSTPAPRPADARIEPLAQRQRDVDSRRILAEELRREEDKLVALKRDYNNGEPERRGEERNYQTYLDRVASMKIAITRVESDIAAIKRELAKIGS